MSSGDSAIGISLSDGQIGFISFTASEQSIRLSRPHTQEAWSVAWSETQDEEDVHLSLYSGGDDSALCKSGDALSCTDSDDEEGILQLSLNRLARDSKTHGAGVTAILPTNYLEEGKGQVIVTGSYDEHIRILTVAHGKTANVLAEKKIPGGGVWRLKIIRTGDGDGVPSWKVLASCMHAGPRMIEIYRKKEGKWEIDIFAKCIEHGSMNYASDAQSAVPGGPLDVVSTSFYDRLCCLWDMPKR